MCLVNKAKSQLFRSLLNFKFFLNHVDFVSQPACQPAVRPGCARCKALKITQNNRLLCRIYETVVLKTISYCAMVILLSFLTLLSSLSIGMRKQLASPQHSIHGANKEVNAPAILYCIKRFRKGYCFTF